jgi:hydrogenase maturation protease
LRVPVQKVSKMGKQEKYLVIGVGNRFRSDDAVGLVVAAHLQNHDLPPQVEIVQAGTDEFGLIEHFKTAEHVVVIDAVSTSKPPGTINIFTADKVKMIPTAGNMALHGFGLADVIALAGKLKISPRITIVGIEPQSMELGEKLSRVVASQVPAMVQAVFDVINNSGQG